MLFKSMLANNISSVIAIMVILLTSGCVMPPMTKTRLPELVEELGTHRFSVEEKQTIGKLLHYINDLENNVR